MRPSSPRRQRTPKVCINLTNCKYDLLHAVHSQLGWLEADDTENWDVFWSDQSISLARAVAMQPMQKINHFAGMLELCRKKTLARSISAMASHFPGLYQFCPKTYVLPEDLQALWKDFKSPKKGKIKTFILKPDSGSQGRGIKLVQSAAGLQQALKDLEGVEIIASKYLRKPLLVNGFKFDLRVYVLVLACDPLRVFIYKEGLVRFCTEKYKSPQASNLKAAYMHLTNYAVNKHNENFVSGPEADSSKWDFATLRRWMLEQGHDFDAIWQQIEELVVMSLLAVQPLLQLNYRTAFPATNDGFSCFEVLGYDVLLDEKCRPWLLEVNHSPSFSTDTPLDLAIKTQLIVETLALVRVDAKQLRRGKAADKQLAAERLLRAKGRATADQPSAVSLDEMQSIRLAAAHKREKYESRHLGNFKRIYPSAAAPLQAKYERLLQGSARLFASSMKAKPHNTIGRIQERRKVDMQMAAEAEAAGKVKASLLRENIRKANQKVLVEAERLKAEGRVTREAASQALLAALRNQTPSGYPMVQSAHCHCAGVSSSPVGNMQHDFRADKTNETACIVQPLEMSRQRMTADDILLRQRFATPLVDMSLGKGPLKSPQSPYGGLCATPMGSAHKPSSRRSQDLDSQGSLDSDSQLGSAANGSAAVDSCGPVTRRLSYRMPAQKPCTLGPDVGEMASSRRSQLSCETDSAGEKQSVATASVSVTQAGAFPVRQRSRGNLQHGLHVKSNLTMERFPVSPRLLGQRSVSLMRRPARAAMQSDTPVADLQLTGAPLQSFNSRAVSSSRSLPRSRGTDDCGASCSNSVQSDFLLNLPQSHSIGETSVPTVEGKVGQDCLRAQGTSDGSIAAGVMSDLPMPPTLSQLLQSSNQNILRQSIDLYSMLGQ